MVNETLFQTPEYVVTTVGIGYIATAVILIPLHIICSWLMWQDKEMRSPTYQFIINLSIADVLELVPLGFYAGVVILFRLPINYKFDRFMSFWCLTAWYVNCVLFIFIAFSRWITMTRQHLVTHIFTKRTLYIMHGLPWVVVALFYVYSTILYPVPLFALIPELFTWGFDLNDPFGLYLHWHNCWFNGLSALIDMSFNISSLKWVHQTRKTIQTITGAENRRREINLLLQCFITSLFFTLCSIMFTIVFAAGLASPMICLCVQIVWTSNHVVNPIVYLSVNSKLRKAFIRFCTCYKFGNTNFIVKAIRIGRTSSGAN